MKKQANEQTRELVNDIFNDTQPNKEGFTKGEWKFDGLECVIDEQGLIIADIRPCNHDGDELDSIFNANQEQAEANAKLICQAPAMYEALKESNSYLYALLSWQTDKEKETVIKNQISINHEIISKANQIKQ